MTKILVIILVLLFIFGGFKPLIRFVKNAFGFKDEPKKRDKERERLTRSKQDLSQKKKKYFNEDDGEYTEYEEVE